ncbi:DUF4123 domain-containing protein [Jannaschia marina]|uniref:DUF4123 domain-containing protein n=1 Tax=Jannaschia marina TaxID=2741674 RepID=UPI0015C9801A|nr:DUF4123 domain-containing protein [Jannaschia marina]
MAEARDEDFWTNLTGDANGSAAASAPELTIETLDGIEPLEDQFGAAEPLSVPVSLRAVLFGQTEQGEMDRSLPPLHTYAVLDSAKVPGLPEILETSDLDHACLFQGEAARELRDVAPWIVRLQEGHRLTRMLFSGGMGPGRLWETGPGIYLRSRKGLRDVHGHLRHLSKVRVEDGGWLFFRYWDADAMQAYLAGLTNRPETSRRWFGSRDGIVIESLILSARRRTCTVQVQSPQVPRTWPTGPVVFTATDRDAVARARRDRRLTDLSDLLAQSFPDISESHTEADRDRLVRRTVGRMQEFGLLQIDALFVCCAWELAYGPSFERRDVTGTLTEILLRPTDETTKIRALRARMDELAASEMRESSA